MSDNKPKKSVLGNEIRLLASQFAEATSTEGDSGKTRTGTISGLEHAAAMADRHYEQVECLFFNIGRLAGGLDAEQAVRNIAEAVQLYQSDVKPFCTKSGGFLKDCPFVEVPGSQSVSEYEPSVVHYQSKCTRCGEILFHTRTQVIH